MFVFFLRINQEKKMYAQLKKKVKKAFTLYIFTYLCGVKYYVELAKSNNYEKKYSFCIAISDVCCCCKLVCTRHY